MTQELRYPDPPIRDPHFVLRPWQAEDAEAVTEACADPVTQRFIKAMPRPYTIEHARAFINGAGDNLREGTAIGLAISEPEHGRAIGSITLHVVRPTHWYIGYWLAPAWRQRGITSAAVQAFSRWAFATNPALGRLSLFTLPENIASRRVAEKAGFMREGLLRQWDSSSGVPDDVVMFSLVRMDLTNGTETGD